MLFTCLPEGAQISGRFPGPAHARGKWFTIDIHCHLLTPKAEEMVAADHVLMGTDYPADMGEVDPIGFIEGAPGLDDSERRAILGGNAARLLNIKAPPLTARGS